MIFFSFLYTWQKVKNNQPYNYSFRKNYIFHECRIKIYADDYVI